MSAIKTKSLIRCLKSISGCSPSNFKVFPEVCGFGRFENQLMNTMISIEGNRLIEVLREIQQLEVRT